MKPSRYGRRERLAAAPLGAAVGTAAVLVAAGILLLVFTGDPALLWGALGASVGVVGLRLLARHQSRQAKSGRV